ncbi:TetR/AcrR family transcriptional regulator [Kitasatospora sp. CB01950]|uniref:TetR/AcrR family transcriptional regulator n=1 Tax=Kitasatospora sp. CB01950 TaxID=1703930 RepID=UPI00093FA5AA|nr:TetR/AcrR family transcriptional regulator [Kitasatospora sp. CB01950]OKJ13984.1 TetR family transcriptional regulator [Kitasatospora sp. CB01950]
MAVKRASQVKKSVWLTPQPARGRRSTRAASPAAGGAGGLDREVIVAAAVRLLDEHGETKFSMRALAARLDVTPMSLYWYVADKEDLLELALDVVSGEMELPRPEDGLGWQDGLRALAVTWRAAMLAHPWAVRLFNDYLNIGPNSVRYSARAVQVARSSPLSEADAMAALSAIFQYTYGFTAVEVNWQEKADAAGTTEEGLIAEITEAVTKVPSIAESGALTERPKGPEAVLREQHFHRALDWMLTGMTASAAQAGVSRTGASRAGSSQAPA